MGAHAGAQGFRRGDVYKRQGEYDAVIIGHSQFEKIPVSMERQQRLLAEQIFEVEEGLRELKSQRAERFTIKSLERTKRGLEAKRKKLQDVYKRQWQSWRNRQSPASPSSSWSWRRRRAGNRRRRDVYKRQGVCSTARR